MITRYNSYHLDDKAQVYWDDLAKQLLEKETFEDKDVATLLKGTTLPSTVKLHD